ncbi:MAG TPA: DUF4091 domain-containing protein, partial [Salinimicrobium sp.]|nr:DUF4091 domain-containing protein [Salinimicrobium sp.]
TGQPPFPVLNYKELPNPMPTNAELWEDRKKPFVSWGSSYVRYKKEVPVPMEKAKNKINLPAWRGERVSAQFVVSAYEKPLQLSFEVSDLISNKNKSEKISESQILTGFVRYVMTDELNKDGKGGCGYRKAVDYDSTLVADPIDHLTKKLKVPVNTTRPGWVRIWVPRNTTPGKYTGNVIIRDDQKILKKLKLTVDVNPRILPKPADWKFHLDLWQNPFAVARYYQIELWSPEHFEHLRKDMKNYANAGGKVITASIIQKPWNGQTHDAFQSMVKWIKKPDGTWKFDYTVFDKWVSFMMKMGIDQQINCYSMVPWRLSFRYFDQATNSYKSIETAPGEQAYEELWMAMLTSFAKHLKEKGWFDKTYIAMDERDMETMKQTIKVIRKADEDFKISFAGSAHKELFDDIDDYCVSLNDSFPPKVKQKRQEKGKISTFYTSCSQAYPNSFTFSPPAETEWYGWYAAHKNLDGYLRWAYNSWVLEPLLDSRFATWAAGDTYFVYPGGRTSLRFEKLVDGIEAFEKIQLLKAEFKQNNDMESLSKLNKTLELFDKKKLDKMSATEIVKKANEVINSF